MSCPRINIFPAESTLMFVMTVVTLHLVFINSIMRPSSASLLMSSSFMRLVWCLRLKNYFTPSLMPPREHNTSNRCKKTQLARSDEAINKKVCVTCDPGAFEAGNWKHIARTLVRQAFVINKYYFFYLLLAPLHWLLYFFSVWQFKRKKKNEKKNDLKVVINLILRSDFRVFTDTLS